ncbi:hypothetical protein [Dyadobacter sp. CY312]|uniref:hypothetical protein n=1 Tax=Dyadobacter sp. CY312 TaxID=2907303 RepID=UPI001F443BE8|nr:hypothetical protein [Dyadobacter sp. CY312]MCE7042297.1 hypothetical protein [Dyadobacter sp. CY312]
MKKLLVILLFAFVFVGCKDKDDDVDADLGMNAVGNYTMTSLGKGGVNLDLPFQGLSGTIKSTRVNATTAFMIIETNDNGTIENMGEGEINLSKSGEKIILKENGTEIGDIEGNTLTLNIADDDGINIKIQAKK